MQAHVLAHFAIKNEAGFLAPQFPFLCLTVSGGHTQIVLVKDYFEMEILGQTNDDAAGEAFDKIAKIIGLPYPGGPLVDKFAKEGNPFAFKFPHPRSPNLDFSFSGLKTSVLYFLKKEKDKNPQFVEQHKNDLCASVQHTIVSILLEKLEKASLQTGIKEIAIAGGVSANSGLRNALQKKKAEKNWNIFIPPFEYCTDNAAMIAVTGYYKFLKNDFALQDTAPFARYNGF
jgi:N6-L-threonylcarbamoyladenine synthase